MATTAVSHHEKTIGRRELIILVALLMSLNALSIDAMLPALDDMARELGVARGNDRQLIIAVYMLAMGIGSLVPGVYADRFGRRATLLVALGAYGLLSFLITLIHDFDLMLVARFCQGACGAALTVVPIAVIRDQYEGDRMARLMSLVSAVFITVPVIAPSLGQVILWVGGWRWIFAALAALSGLVAIWVNARLPETLDPANRQDIHLPTIGRNMMTGLFDRQAIGYVIGTALLVGGVFGYINSSQQLLVEHFQVGSWFPIVFGATASMMAFASLVNSRIVERFGARRVSHTGMLTFIVVSAGQLYSSYFHPDSLAWFLPLMSLNLGLLGFLSANFSSIAMQPFAHIAGAASSVQAFVRMLGAAIVGLMIGQAFDGTALPFAWALLISSVLATFLVFYSEKGRLFRRLYRPQQPATPVR